MAASNKKNPRSRGKKDAKAPAKAFSTTRELELIAALNEGETTSPAQLLGSSALAIKIRGVISTQCPSINRAIGRGGYPLGRLILLSGKEGSGKTTLALHAVAETQQRGGMVLYADAEHKLDPDYAAAIGVDLKRLIISQPDYIEKLLANIETTCGVVKKHRKRGSKFPALVVLDSINALPAKAEFDGTWEDRHIAPEAGVYSSKLKKLTPIISREDVTFLMISQEREKVGVVFGRKEQTGGGRAPRFYSSLILEVSRIGQIKGKGDEIVGNETLVKCAKNQISPPFRKAEFNIMFGKGIDYENSLFRLALDDGIIKQSGAWYNYGAERIAHGAANAAEAIRNTPSLKAKLEEAIK